MSTDATPACGMPSRPFHVTAGKRQRARYALTFGLAVPADREALEALEPAALDAAYDIVGDLAHQRVRGKLASRRAWSAAPSLRSSAWPGTRRLQPHCRCSDTAAAQQGSDI